MRESHFKNMKLLGYGVMRTLKAIRHVISQIAKLRVLSARTKDSPNKTLTTWWNQPFNGQLMRFQTCIEVCLKFKPQIAIETGTFYGTTTVALSSLVEGKTYTIEINPMYVNIAQSYFYDADIDKDRIEVITGNSSREIETVLSNISKSCRLLVYLDAHWGNHLPLKDELSALIKWGGAFFAIIDDFYIPHESNFGFDVHDSTRIDLELIPKDFSGQIFFPSHLAKQEYGARRGTCYLFSNRAIDLMPDLKFNFIERVQE